MEESNSVKPPFRFKFHGSGGTLFGIVFINTILTFVTLGFYYPWARAKLLKYLYSETEFNGNRFEFHGTGKEMFKGFLKVIAILIVVYIVAFGGALMKKPGLILLVYLNYYWHHTFCHTWGYAIPLVAHLLARNPLWIPRRFERVSEPFF